MKVDIRDNGRWQKVLAIEVARDDLAADYDAVLEDMRRTTALPGFRKGKVPRSMLEAQFGHSLEHDVLERAVRRTYEQALKELNLDPVYYPAIEKIRFDPGQPLSYEAHLHLRPVLAESDYADLEIVMSEVEVTDESVQRAIEDLRQKAAEWTPVDRPAGAGDAVLLDYVRLNAKGKPLTRTEQKDTLIELGAEGLLPEFRDNLQGRKEGDHLTFTVNYPPEFANEELRGRTATFSVQVRGVRERKLRDLDDAFASEVVGLKDLAELRARVRLNLEGETRLRAMRQQESGLVDQLLARNPLELPERMVGEYLQTLEERLKEPGQEWTEEHAARFRDEYRPAAERQIKRELLLDAVAAARGITVSDAEIDAALRGSGEGETPPPETERLLRQPAQRERARSHITERKVFALLREKARVKMAVA